MDDNNLSELITKLQDDSLGKSQEGAVEISEIARESPEEAEEAIEPLINEFNRSEPDNRLKGKTASALAHLAQEYPHEVSGIEKELIATVSEGNRFNKMNASMAIAALKPESALPTLREIHENTSETSVKVSTFLAIHAIDEDSAVPAEVEHIYAYNSGGVGEIAKRTEEHPERGYPEVFASILGFEDPGGNINKLLNIALYESEHLRDIVPLLCRKLGGYQPDEKPARYIIEVLGRCTDKYPDHIADNIVKYDLVDHVAESIKSIEHNSTKGDAVHVLGTVASYYPEEAEKYYGLFESLSGHEEGYIRESSEYSLSSIEDYRNWKMGQENTINVPDDKDKSMNKYWRLVGEKQSAMRDFIEDPSEDGLIKLLDTFWTLRSDPPGDYKIQEGDLSKHSPGEVAQTFAQAVQDDDISTAIQLNGFDIKSASEVLRALQPDRYPIMSGPSIEGIRALGYEVPSSGISPEEYDEFRESFNQAIEEYDLISIAEEVCGSEIPDWATELQICDNLFYRHTDDDYELNLTQRVETERSYYWVNQNNMQEIQKGYLRAPVDNEFSHDLSVLKPGDVVFHYHDAEILGYSEVLQNAERLREDGEEYYRVEVERLSEEAVEREEIRGKLMEDSVKLDKYYPFNKFGGINTGYLFHLSGEAGEYILKRLDGIHWKDRLGIFNEHEDIEIDIRDLYFPKKIKEDIEEQVVSTLENGNHILFVGPPGTGKSKLARQIAQSIVGSDYEFVTANSDWSTFDTVGGYHPEKDESLQFKPGVFLDRFKNAEGNPRNEWLIIDEINRADIDKAFGSLFSVLAGDDVTLSFTDENDRSIRVACNGEPDRGTRDNVYYVPDDWRMIATMNTLDKTSLYEMSYAFMRRWAFVSVPVPNLKDRDNPADLVENYVDVWTDDGDETKYEDIAELWRIINRHRKIGPAIVEDIYEHVEHSSNPDYASAISMYVIPQLEGLRENEISQFVSALEDADVEIDVGRVKDFVEEYFQVDLDGNE